MWLSMWLDKIMKWTDLHRQKHINISYSIILYSILFYSIVSYYIPFYKLTKIGRAFWLVKKLWFIVPVNS